MVEQELWISVLHVYVSRRKIKIFYLNHIWHGKKFFFRFWIKREGAKCFVSFGSRDLQTRFCGMMVVLLCQLPAEVSSQQWWALGPYKHWAVLLLLRHSVTASLSKWHRRLFGWGKHALEPRVMSALAQPYENMTEISLYSTVSSIPRSCMFPSFMKPKGALMLKVNYISVTV